MKELLIVKTFLLTPKKSAINLTMTSCRSRLHFELLLLFILIHSRQLKSAPFEILISVNEEKFLTSWHHEFVARFHYTRVNVETSSSQLEIVNLSVKSLSSCRVAKYNITIFMMIHKNLTLFNGFFLVHRIGYESFAKHPHLCCE
jgi:hypothetical protein